MKKIVLHKSHSEPVLNGGTGTSGHGATEQKIQSEVIDKLIERLRNVVDSDGKPVYEAVSYNGVTIPKVVTGDLFISPHCDGAPPTARGFSIAVPELQSVALKRESEIFMDALSSKWAKHNPEIPARKRPDGTFVTTINMRQFYGFQYPMKVMPCVLVEMGFLTNAQDAIFLKDTQRMANTIFDAIRSYFPPPVSDFKEWTWAVQKGIIPAGMQMSTPMTAVDIAKMLYKLNQ